MTTKAKLVLSLVGAIVLAANVVTYLLYRKVTNENQMTAIGYIGFTFAVALIFFILGTMWRAIKDANKNQKENDDGLLQNGRVGDPGVLGDIAGADGLRGPGGLAHPPRRGKAALSLIVYGLFLFFAVKTYPVKSYCDCTVGGDFLAYYQAAQGKFETEWPPEYRTTVDRLEKEFGCKMNYMYAHWTAAFFWPFTLLPIGTAYLIWYVLTIGAVLFLAKKIMEISHGWIFALAGLKVAIFHWQSGNVAPILAALSLTYLGSLLAICIKPYYALFAFVHAERLASGRGGRRDDLGDSKVLDRPRAGAGSPEAQG